MSFILKYSTASLFPLLGLIRSCGEAGTSNLPVTAKRLGRKQTGPEESRTYVNTAARRALRNDKVKAELSQALKTRRGQHAS